jgi:hypothetical protein
VFVRVARFEGLDTSNLEADMERFRQMVRMEERPEGMDEQVFQTLRDGVKRFIAVVDRERGVSLDLAFTATEDDARRAHEALDSRTPPEGAGRRTNVETYELMVDEQLA